MFHAIADCQPKPQLSHAPAGFREARTLGLGVGRITFRAHLQAQADVSPNFFATSQTVDIFFPGPIQHHSLIHRQYS